VALPLVAWLVIASQLLGHESERERARATRAYRADFESKMVSDGEGGLVFRTETPRFLEKTFSTIAQCRISRRFFWLIWNISRFFRFAVNRKNALSLPLVELETSR
jgi:hypothetical protein